MTKNHKDLPGGSQAWASEVDASMAELKALREVVQRLAQNAGLDMANPKRGINAGAAPSVQNPVGQKLSSLADVQIYNVADKQVLTWNQMSQRWLPASISGLVPFEPRDAIDPTATNDAQALGHNEEAEGEPYAFYYFNEITAGLAASYNGVGVSTIGLGQSGGPILFCSDGAGNYSMFGCRHDYFHVTSPLADFRGVEMFVLKRHTSRPADPQPGTVVIESSTNKIIHWTGTAWVDALGTAV